MARTFRCEDRHGNVYVVPHGRIETAYNLESFYKLDPAARRKAAESAANELLDMLTSAEPYGTGR